jgi:hypothetical protein
MKKLLLVLALVVVASASLGAETNFGFGIGYETGSVAGVPNTSAMGATTTNPGNTPLLQYMPEIFLESVFRHNPAEGALGIDIVLSWSMTEEPAYVAAYQPFEYVYSDYTNPAGDPGITSNNPELFLGADLSYHFPRLGPLDIGILVGGLGWTDIGDTSQVDLPISAGIAAQAGGELTLHFGGIFIQGKALYRFYYWEAAAVGGGGTPAPLGTYCFIALAGFSF